MKASLKDVIGKEVAAVVVAEAGSDPRQQVFLVFRDGTCFEFHGRDFSCCAGLDPAERIERYVEGGGGRIVRVYGDAMAIASAQPSSPRAQPQASSPRARQEPQRPGAQSPTEQLLSRDLAAWLLAKEAIRRAARRD